VNPRPAGGARVLTEKGELTQALDRKLLNHQHTRGSSVTISQGNEYYPHGGCEGQGVLEKRASQGTSRSQANTKKKEGWRVASAQ